MPERAQSSQLELVALTLLDHADEPVGAARLAEAWRQSGLSGAEATAGRYLRQLDARGLTCIHRTTKGRVLTEHGQARLQRLLRRQRQDAHGAQLMQAINVSDIGELIDLLSLRRMVETEACRLAAQRASDEEIAHLIAVAKAQVSAVSEGQQTMAPSLSFHRLVADASHNRMLTAVARLLLDPIHDPLEKVLETIAEGTGETLDQASDHVDLADALLRRDPLAAGQLMQRHMDKLIQSAVAYRNLDSPSPG